MKREANDIYEMLDTLALPVAAQCKNRRLSAHCTLN